MPKHRCTDVLGLMFSVGVQPFYYYLCPVSDLAPGQMGIDDMKMLEQKAQQLAAEAEQDKPKLKEKILFVRYVFCLFILCVKKQWLEILCFSKSTNTTL